MTVCCRCNASGRCRTCVCARANRPCSNCLPARNSHCLNIQQPLPPPNLAPPQDLQPSAIPDSASPTSPTPRSTPSSPVDDSDPTSPMTTPANLPTPTPPAVQPLPSPSPMATPSFVWGERDAITFSHSLEAAYAEVVHWKPNTFPIPFGNAGKKFTQELSRLFRAYAEGTALESIALKATTVLPILLLQKPARNSKAKDHTSCLDRRLKTWYEGDINSLVLEGRCLQMRLPKTPSWKRNKESLARSFSKLMFKGKVSAALNLLAKKGNGGILHTSDQADKGDPSSPTVLDVLRSKYPTAQIATAAAQIQESSTPHEIHPPLSLNELIPAPSTLPPSTAGALLALLASTPTAGNVSVLPFILPPEISVTP